MFCIRTGNLEELGKVKGFYDSLIEEMQGTEYDPGWRKDIYPTGEMLREALENGELYIGEEEGETAACMILNRTCNERYQEISWKTEAGPDQVLAVHTFGVHPRFSRRGLGKKMMEEAVKIAGEQGLKAIRLDVLTGNLPAKKVYRNVGFQYAGALKIYYEDTGWADFDLYEYSLSDKSGEEEKIYEKDGYLLRPAREEDAGEYYENNFHPFDPETARLTGSRTDFSRDEVVGFFKKCIEDRNRYDFLILSPEGKIIGESVLNEIDWEVRKANFRIAVFHPEDCGKGIGSWAIKSTLDFAFREVKLHRVELDVFSFNPRAIRAYEKAGFRREGVLREAVKDGDRYGDDILMAILEDEWV